MADFETVGKQFVEHYYKMFAEDRPQLMNLYGDQSMMSFEGEQFLGGQSILTKLHTFGQVNHKITTFDAQPTSGEGIICMISGDLSIEGGNPLKFA